MVLGPVPLNLVAPFNWGAKKELMIKHNRLPKNIERLFPKAEAYLQSRSDVAFAYLFGGLARGRPNKKYGTIN